MLTACVVLFLASRGEAPREEKFGGDAAHINDQSAERELAELIRTRPSLTGPAITLSIGIGVGLLGGAGIVAGLLLDGLGGLALALSGFVVCSIGLVVVLITGVVMIAITVARNARDVRIRALQERQAGLTLARF